MTLAADPPRGDVLELHVDAPAPGVWNMQRDLELLHACRRGEIAGAVRVYGFSPPCLSLGRLQSDDDVDWEACARDGVDVVRRPSGGRAVLHDREVTYAVVCSRRDPVFGGRVLESCARIHAAVAQALARLGVHTVVNAPARDARGAAVRAAASADCFAVAAAHELLDVQGRKLVGSAQARLGGALLQHGSVLIEPARAATYVRGARPLPGTGVSGLLGRAVGAAELTAALTEGFAAALPGRLARPAT